MNAPALAALWLAASADAGSRDERGAAVIREDVSVRSKAAGPALALPTPRADRAVVDEVVDSLKLMNEGHSVKALGVAAPSSAKLARPFPGAPYLVFAPRTVTAPYDLWTFEILDQGGEVLWRQEGTGRVVEPLEWDGSGPSGDDAVRVAGTYSFRFTGRRGPDSFVVTSEPARLKSLSTREYLGGTRLEVANEELFQSGKAEFKDAAVDYLNVMVDRQRRFAPKDGYHLELRQAEPKAPLSRRRAEHLRRWFADRLVINSSLVEVSLLSTASRGDITACLLPADKGEAFSQE